ncbi:type II CRISPR-associated endonuclease Cas1 [Albimonas sp. CAU 1670]|uniref:type II CRISPR-associated endonuclease Cas1 n=1 Tax=Albimonas sp. CAU 1670 TaxID=3032599 RepID=UPI0023DBFB0F|nr:type II CRISPR-associated endonuclease Cas1 [Albimonas sp. CAU 1670]MDF2235763.1 type II CRISPR-associated endonuclease Cas1 [Albimonas sp. CAU 1670]
MDQVLDIATDGRHLSRARGFLVVSEGHEEVGRVPLDQIAAVIVHAHGVTWSNSLLVALAERGAPVVVCAASHAPQAILWPLEGHVTQGARMRAQWEAKRPLQKRLWQAIVVRKILMQAAALDAFGAPTAPLLHLARAVRSGDEGNLEAQAARRYWPLMMGEEFRREVGGGGMNGLLNYGYTVLRAAVARAVVAAGLNPTMGLFHRNRGNAFALADDMVEPFRPLVDCAVRGMSARGVSEVTPEAKRVLGRLIALDLDVEGERSPLTAVLSRQTFSLARSFETGRDMLLFPEAPSALELRSLGAEL